MNIKQIFLGLVTYFTVTTLFASTPLFTLDPTTPTTIRMSPYDRASVQYRVTNRMATPQTLGMVPIAGITQSTSDAGACGTTFSLQPGQSCLLNLSTDGTKVPIITAPKICKVDNNSNPTPFLCARSSQAASLNIQARPYPTYAYLTNTKQDILEQCDLSATGSLTNCSTSPVDNLKAPRSLVINPTQTRLYIVSRGNDVVIQCNIDRPTGTLSQCTNANADDLNPDDLLERPTGITTNPAGTIVYIADDNKDRIIQCPVNTTTGGFDNNCSVASNAAVFVNPEGIAISPDNLFAYINNRSDNLAGELVQCNVATNGNLTGCAVVAGTDPALTFKQLTLNSDGSILYVSAKSTTSDATSVYQCAIVSGAVGTCTNSATYTDIIGSPPLGIAVNSSDNILYVVSDADSPAAPYAQCSVSVAGAVTNCTNPTATPTDSSGIALLE